MNPMAQRAPQIPQTVEDFRREYIRSGPFPISNEDYLWLVLEDSNAPWELHDGLLVEKLGMSVWHGDSTFYLAYQIASQVDRKQFRLRSNHGRIRASGNSYFVPDVIVIPTHMIGPDPNRIDVYEDAMPFVAESLSPSTRTYDVLKKLPVYRARSDREIWLLDPPKHSVRMWRLMDDDGYDEQVVTGGKIELHALPGVVIDIDALFDI